MQIGSTPRDGYYGACFLQPTNRTNNIADAKVYCARPGSRLWEADVDGRVLKTSQYKPVDAGQATADNKQSLQLLRRLQPIFGKFIFSHTKNSFCIVDPTTSNIVLSNEHQFHDIDNVKIVNGSTLIIFTSKSQLFSLSCRSIEDCFVDRLTEQKYDECVKLLLANRSYFNEMCRTGGFVAQVLRLQNALTVHNQITDDLKTIFSELTASQLQQTIVVPVVRQQQDNGIFAVDNGFTMNAKNRNHSGPTISADENIRTVLMSASRNLFNKLNIFNDTDDADNTAAVGQVLCDRPSIIPYQNVDQLNHSDEIVATVYRPNRMVVQRETTSNHIALHKQLTAEDKLLQNLFMIYKSSRMSQLSLVERYCTIFDQYDCHTIRELLEKLAIIMQQNNIVETVARLHCYEMYFNYLNHDLIWEFDDEARQFIINGFILINQPVDPVTIVCTDCRFPLMLRKPTACRYRDIGATVMKYFWSRNQLQQCYELAAAVPWTVELLCKFWLNNENDCRNDVAKVIRLVFATSTEAMWLKAIQCAWFGDEAWTECFELMVRMHRQRQMICANCDKCSTNGNGGNAWHTIESHEFYAWSRFLDTLVHQVHGRTAIRLVRQYSSQIPCDAVPKEFYLKCLLLP